MVKRFNWLVFCLLFSVGMMAKSGGRQYNSYKGLVMAGYQGWFNAPGDGSGRGWHHYNGSNGFRPGSCSVDFWPEVSEYKKLYKTEFTFADGKPASVFSSYDESTVDLHFKWMKQYGLDGVFMQRFVAEIRNESGLKHFNKVLNSAMKSANKYERAICVMYDLSGMQLGEEKLLLKDIDDKRARILYGSALFDTANYDDEYEYAWQQFKFIDGDVEYASAPKAKYEEKIYTVAVLLLSQLYRQGLGEKHTKSNLEKSVNLLNFVKSYLTNEGMLELVDEELRHYQKKMLGGYKYV